jgi:hypothetical protein
MRKVTVLALIFILFLSCNKSSIIEGVGPIGTNSGTSSPLVEQGTLTIYASNSSCTNIRITIDDVYKGTINPTTKNIPCGTVNQNAVSIRLKVGTHTYNAIYICIVPLDFSWIALLSLDDEFYFLHRLYIKAYCYENPFTPLHHHHSSLPLFSISLIFLIVLSYHP